MIANDSEDSTILEEPPPDPPESKLKKERLGGYWRKLPCPKHAERFAFECPDCNANNQEWVEITR